ncbi:MAG: HAMP domain-containing histidine kinase [Burkholderiales bacterium]|nr:HAMP domain-containing histidine kinase [Burkholderiales bacterium]
MTPRRLPLSPARRLLLMVLCALHLASGAARAQAVAVADPGRGGSDAAQVLVISGTDPYLPAFVAIDSAMRDAMARRRQGPVVWIHESIDTARFGREPGPMLAQLLARKYESVDIDAVVLVTEPAVDFYLRHRERLWPEAPVVFHFVAPGYAERLPAGAGLSGIPAQVDFAGAVRVALALQPNARRAVVVGGFSPFDEVQLAGFREALSPLAGRLQVEYLVGLSPQQAAERLAGEMRDTIVFFATLFRDADGRVYVPRTALETLTAASSAPIYGVYESQIGHGLAAGAVESFTARGERLADLVMRAIDGSLAGRPVIEPPPPSRCVADGRQLKRYGLSARSLPAGCEVRFVEPGFFERYWWQSLLVALALLAQTLLITSLLLQRRRRRAAELSMQAQRVQLLHASRLAVAGELTASIAHEINQPLGAILSNADAAEMLVQSGTMGREELLQILADIRRDDLRASEVIKRLRALLARQETERRRFDLNEAVRSTAGILRAEARRREVDVAYDLRAERADVLGDAVQIQQVIINLMLNAFDASAEVPEAARRVRVETRDTANGVQVSVRDFGVGIALADLPRVFDSFFSTKRSGMGLGLAIARSIVEAHGGTISAASCEVGAEFRFILPLAPAADLPEPAAASTP